MAFLANLVFPQYQDQKFYFLRSGPHEFWDTFTRWDSGWYQDIAAQGYEFREGGRNNLAFAPVYPLLMRAGGTVLGGRQEDFYFAGIVISWLAFAAAMVMLFKLARLDFDRRVALRAVMFAAVFPFAYFFGVVYSESVFFLALVTATYAFRTRRWVAAAVCGAAMTATRVTGVMAIPGLAWVAWRAAGPETSTRTRALLAASACLSGIALYSLYNYAVSGSPFAWYESITRWGYYPGGNPFGSLIALVGALLTRPYQFFVTNRFAPYDTLNALAALTALALIPVIWRRLNGGYALIVLAGLLLPLSSGQFEGLGRYCSVQFPIALVLASFEGETRQQILLVASAVLYAMGLAMFVTVHPLF